QTLREQKNGVLRDVVRHVVGAVDGVALLDDGGASVHALPGPRGVDRTAVTARQLLYFRPVVRRHAGHVLRRELLPRDTRGNALAWNSVRHNSSPIRSHAIHLLYRAFLLSPQL